MRVARLSGSFDAISHDVNQPLSQAIQTGQATIFASTPLAILQPRTAIAWQIAPKTVLRSGFGLFSDLLPGSVVDLVGVNPPYSKTFQGGLLGTVGGTAIAPGVPNSAIDATIAANQALQLGLRARPALLRVAHCPIPTTCLQPVAITAVPDGKLHAPYFMQWSFALEHQIGSAHQSARPVCRHARGEPALHDSGERLSDRVRRVALRRSPMAQPTDPRFGAVTQLNTGANSHYNGLQLTAEKRLGHGLQVQANYTWSHCMDTVSNGGFLPFSAGGILSPIPGDLGRQYGPCDYDVRHNFTAQYVYQLPVKVRNRVLGHGAERMAGIRNGVLAQRHSVLGPERAVLRQRKRHREGQRSAIRQRRSRRAALRAQRDSRRDAARNDPVAEPGCFCFDGRSKHRRLRRRRHAEELPVRQSGPQRPARSPTSPGAIFISPSGSR